MTATGRLATFYFAYFCHLGAFVAYFALWLDARGFSPAEIAVVLAAPQFVRVVAPTLWGWLADLRAERFPGGLRGLVVLQSLLAAVCFSLLTQASEWRSAFAWVALTAIFTSGVLPLVEATTLSVLGPRIEGYGPVRVWGSIGFIVSVLAVGMLLDRAPASIVTPIIAALLVATALSAALLPRGRIDPAPGGAARVGEVLREPRVAALLGACFCMSVAHGALYAFYTLYLVEHGYSKSLIGVLWTLGVLAEIVLFLALPVLLRRHTLRALLLVSFLAAGVRFTAIGWGVASLALLAAAQLLHGLTFGAYHAAAVAAVHRLFKGALAVRGQALYASFSYGLGGASGLLLSGWCWSALGPELTFTVSSAFGLAGACLVFWRVRL